MSIGERSIYKRRPNINSPELTKFFDEWEEKCLKKVD